MDGIRKDDYFMAKVYAFLAEGFEETEAVAVIDVMKRGGIDVVMVSINDNTIVKGVHGINIEADDVIDNIDIDNADMLFLPGGVPGTPNLAACKKLEEALLKYNSEGKRLSAICAAPSVLGQLGILKGKEAACYPGWEDKLTGATHKNVNVVTSDNISTGKGMGAAIDLGLEIVKIFCGEDKAVEVGKAIQYL